MLTATITLPAWVFLLFGALLFGQSWLNTKQLDYLRQLFRIYFKAQYGEDYDDFAARGDEG